MIKKIFILGIVMFLVGFIGFSILCGSAVSATYTSGSTHFVDIWHLFGITHIAIGFVVMGFIGLILATIGIFMESK